MNEWESVFEAVNVEDVLSPTVQAIRSILEAVSLKVAPTTDEVLRYESLLKEVKRHQQLTIESGRIRWRLDSNVKNSDYVLLLESEDLLLHGDVGRIKRCPGDGCHIIFYDGSKNQSKKWCAMAHCGMLTKSKKFYDTHRRVSK